MSRPVRSQPDRARITGSPTGHAVRRIAGSLAAGVLALTVLSGCTGSVDVAPAPASNDPRCAPVMIALPQDLAGQAKRTTTSQATAAWGDPSAAVLRCGVPSPGPTTDRCVTVNGVDWITTEEGDHWRLVTYGREPAVELLLDTSRAASSTALVQLASPVAQLSQTRKCLDIRDADPTATATATPTAPTAPTPGASTEPTPTTPTSTGR